jgi:hypothetical protein
MDIHKHQRHINYEIAKIYHNLFDKFFTRMVRDWSMGCRMMAGLASMVAEDETLVFLGNCELTDDCMVCISSRQIQLGDRTNTHTPSSIIRSPNGILTVIYTIESQNHSYYHGHIWDQATALLIADPEYMDWIDKMRMFNERSQYNAEHRYIKATYKLREGQVFDMESFEDHWYRSDHFDELVLSEDDDMEKIDEDEPNPMLCPPTDGHPMTVYLHEMRRDIDVVRFFESCSVSDCDNSVPYIEGGFIGHPERGLEAFIVCTQHTELAPTITPAIVANKRKEDVRRKIEIINKPINHITPPVVIVVSCIKDATWESLDMVDVYVDLVEYSEHILN